MSKEKQCECCHEWWYGSDVKQDLCPNCYYYFKRLKQQLAIKDKMINLIWIDLFHLNNDNNDWTKSVAQYQKEAIEKLKEGDANE